MTARRFVVTWDEYHQAEFVIRLDALADANLAEIAALIEDNMLLPGDKTAARVVRQIEEIPGAPLRPRAEFTRFKGRR